MRRSTKKLWMGLGAAAAAAAASAIPLIIGRKSSVKHEVESTVKDVERKAKKAGTTARNKVRKAVGAKKKEPST